jgi:hypothetical protein
MGSLFSTCRYVLAVAGILVAQTRPCLAQEPPPSTPDTRTQYPRFLANGFFGVSFGAIDAPFTASQLQPGYQAASVQTPDPAFQIVLFGRQFGQYFSAEADYTRPMRWVTYENVNRTGQSHSVWVVLGEFKLTAHVPITARVNLYTDAGVAVTSRHGARADDGAVIVADAHYPAVLVGAGLEYQVNERWSLQAGVTHAAASRTHSQPRTVLVSGGVRYHLPPLRTDRVANASSGGYVFPEHVVQIGYASGTVGYGFNHFVSRTLPVFWGGHVSVDRGFTARYERNVFHTRKWFALDLGAGVSRWQSQKSRDVFSTISFYPLMRFIFLRTRVADLHVSYSLAGPTYISRRVLDGMDVGTNRFTFQDLFGVGVVAGKRRHVAIGVGLGHYSNGNLFPLNAGVAVPLTFSAGYAF